MALDQLPEDYFDEPKEMSFFDHIDELRKHLTRSVIAVIIAALVLFFNKHFLFDVVLFGPMRPDFWTYETLCRAARAITGSDEYCVKDIGFVLSNITLTGQFTQHVFISFIGGLIIAFPYVLWELWRFIKPALSAKEVKYAQGIVFFTSVLFFIGVLFGYYFLTPVSVNFMGSYRVSDAVSNEINLDSYISFVATLTFATGVVFELPMLVYFLAKIGMMSSAWMRKYRKHAFVVILIIAAVVTPPDVGSQMLMTVPLYALFELSIFIARRVERNKARSS